MSWICVLIFPVSVRISFQYMCWQSKHIAIIFFNTFSAPFSLSSWTPVILKLACSMVSHRSHKLSSLFLIFFSLFSLNGWFKGFYFSLFSLKRSLKRFVLGKKNSFVFSFRFFLLLDPFWFSLSIAFVISFIVSLTSECFFFMISIFFENFSFYLHIVFLISLSLCVFL